MLKTYTIMYSYFSNSTFIEFFLLINFYFSVIPYVTLHTTEVTVFLFLFYITSILVKNSWSICFDKFYQRNQHRVIVFRYFATLSRKCAWRYVQWRIKHFTSYDNINKNSFKMKKLQVQCCSVFHSYSGNFVLNSPMLFEN